MSDNDIRVGPRADRLGTTGVLDSALSPVLGDEESSATKPAEQEQTAFIENPLSKFASYNCIVTLAALTKAELADPDNTYRAKGPINQIVKSGGIGDNKIPTSYEQSLGITTEYFIDDTEINAIITSNRSSKQTNATTMNFKVHEPYSMGIFLETLAVTAIAANTDAASYLDSAYVLILEFVGFDDAGKRIEVPNTKRYFPIKLTKVEFNVTAGGSVYDISAVAWNDQALADEVQRINQDIDVSGITVADLLQNNNEETNRPSLTSVLNKIQLDQKESENVPAADAYVIMFPESGASAEDSFKNSDSAEAGATTQSQISQNLEATAEQGVTLEDIQNFASTGGAINEIGQAKVDSVTFTSGNSKFGTSDVVFEDGLAIRGNLEYDQENRYINISQGSRIQDIIEAIILVSDYGKQLATAEPDSRGMLKWFRIETETYEVTDEDNAKQMGRSAKIYVYRVVTYRVHASNFVGASQKSPGISELKKKIPKKYEYIYSGKNDDIINFDIAFNNAFYTAVSMDLFQAGADAQLNGASAGGFIPRPLPTLALDSASRGDTGNEPSGNIERNATTNTNSAVIAGSGTETVEVAISRRFNDILNNGVDLITMEVEILGDPYYLSDSGIGNYRAPTSENQTTADGSIDHQYEESHVIFEFKTPLDYNNDTGRMIFPAAGGEPVKKFSGIYKVITLQNLISQNKFTQNLKLLRVRNQIGEDTEDNKFIKPDDGKPLFDITKIPTLDDILGTSAESLVPIPPSLEELGFSSNNGATESIGDVTGEFTGAPTQPLTAPESEPDEPRQTLESQTPVEGNPSEGF